jgi:arginase
VLDHVRVACATSNAPLTLLDDGDVAVSHCAWSADGFPLRNLTNVRRVAMEQATAVSALLKQGITPLICGGDCTTLLGTARALQMVHQNAGLVSFDAHGDFNTDESTPSGNIHGMTVAAIAGRGHASLLELFRSRAVVPERRIALLGVRDLDREEAVALHNAEVTLLERGAIRAMGAREAALRALRVATGHDDGGDGHVLLHIDVDVLDPGEFPGVGMPVSDGLSVEELLETLEPLLASGRVIAAEITEAAPSLDPSGRTLAVMETLLDLLARGLSTWTQGGNQAIGGPTSAA